MKKKPQLERTNFSLPSYILLIRASLAGKHFQKSHQSANLTLPLSERPADVMLQINPLEVVRESKAEGEQSKPQKHHTLCSSSQDGAGVLLCSLTRPVPQDTFSR